MKKDRDSTEPPIDPEEPDSRPRGVIQVSEDSYPPTEIAAAIPRDSLPALAASQKGRVSAETKLGIAATALAALIVAVAVGWYMLDAQSKTEQIQGMVASQQQLLDKLQKQILTKNAELEQARNEQAAAAARVAAAADASTPAVDAGEEAAETVASPGSAKAPEPIAEGKQEAEKSAAESPEKTKEKRADAIPPSPYGDERPAQPEDPKAKLDQLLGGAPAPQRAEKPQAEPSSRSESRSSPSREQVQSAMESVAPMVKRCGNGKGGTIRLEITVSGRTGRVISADPVDKEYVGTSIGICASRAVSLAKFPPFEKSTVSIKYPFEL